MRAEQRVQDLAMALLLRRSLSDRAKRSMPKREPWLLKMARIATSSIHHCGNQMPRRMRQSGSALRKAIRLVAAEGVWSGEAKGERLRRRTTEPIAGDGEGHWGTLLIDPARALGPRWRLAGLLPHGS